MAGERRAGARRRTVPTDMEPFPVIVGPTAGGKSALAVEVALRANGEVVSADAFQVYRGMDIGTGKPTLDERRGVPHHVIDVREPTEGFSVEQWLGLAEGAIADIRARGRTPVVVGGTHFYIKALLEGLFDGPAADATLRAALHATPAPDLRRELERADPAAASRIHPNDLRRTVRALEVLRLTGRPISAHQGQWDRGEGRRDARLVVLQWPIEAINRRINARVRAMMERGLAEEARALFGAGSLGPQAAEALGYKQLIAHFEGRCGLEAAVEQIKIATRRYAKSQRTWLRRLAAPRLAADPEGPGAPPAKVIDSPDTRPGELAQSLVDTWVE